MINYKAPINTLGYGVCGFNIYKSLYKMNSGINLYPLGGTINIRPTKEEVEVLQNGLDNANRAYISARPSLTVWHEHSLHEVIYSRHTVGALSFFETFPLTERQVANINSVDMFFVSSEWAKQVCLGSGVDEKHVKVKVVPMGVDPIKFYPRPYDKHPETRFFNMGKIEIRKGHDILCDIFNKAFTPKDNVKLYISWDNPFLSDTEKSEWESMYKNSPLGPNIYFLPRLDSDVEVANLMGNMDFGIFPTRAEGFGLPILEMISCGRKIITTDYSAHTEFCNENNSWRTKITEYEDAIDGKWFNGQQKWAALLESNIDEMVDFLREAHKLKQSNSLPSVDSPGLTWDQTAKNLEELLLTR